MRIRILNSGSGYNFYVISTIFQCLVEKVKEKERGTVSVVMEHFNLSQQALLDAYMRGGLEPGGLLAGYAQGEEGHDIQCYAALLEYARLNPDRAVLCIRIRSYR
jgi:uncharacterized iron-regulated protein